MTAPLQSPYKAIDPCAFALAWFKPLGASYPAGADKSIGPKRWGTDLPKPYRWVSVPDNSRGALRYTTRPTVWVNTLAGTVTDAGRAAEETDRRAQVLVDYPGWDVTVNGVIVRCNFAEIIQFAHEEPYAAETVATRFVSEYRFGFTLIAA